MLLEQVNARTVVRCTCFRADQLQRGTGVRAGVCRLVQQDGDGLYRGEAGIGMEFDLLHGHHELRLFHCKPIYAYPAACDVKLGFASRAGKCGGEIFIETDGGKHAEVQVKAGNGIVTLMGREPL